MRVSSSVVVVVTLAGLVTFTPGCAPLEYDTVEYDVVTTDRPPPALRVETIGDAPGPGYVWVDGYWHWDGARYRWVDGYWVVRPAVGMVWVPSGWVASQGRYRYIPGRWAHRERLPRYRYVHPRPRYYKHYSRPPHVRRR